MEPDAFRLCVWLLTGPIVAPGRVKAAAVKMEVLMSDRMMVGIAGIGLLSWWLGYYSALWAIGWPIEVNAAAVSSIVTSAVLTSYGFTGRPSLD